MQSSGTRPIWSENEQLCIILQMEHNTAFVDMMSSLGKDFSSFAACYNVKLLAVSTEQSNCANYLSL